MFRISIACRAAAALSVGLAMSAGAAPLSLEAAIQLAERESPQVAVTAADIAVALSEGRPAGSLPDPKLFAGMDNFPISGAARGQLDRDFMTMQRIGLMQEIPSGAKRQAAVELAQANVESSEARQRVVRQQVRREVALAWISTQLFEQRLQLFDALERENGVLAMTVEAQIAGARAEPADRLLPGQEAVAIADRRDAVLREIARSRATLRRFVGDAADEALDGLAPRFEVAPQSLREHLHHHPELQAFAAQTRQAGAALAEAQARKIPDLAVEVAYQRRGGQFGDMVSVQFTFDLPLNVTERQDPLIAARVQALARVDAERETMLREHLSELENALAEYATAQRSHDRASTIAIPLAQQRVDLLLAGYGAGRGTLAALLEARRALLEQRLRVLELDGQATLVAAQLHYAYLDLEP
jgi:outer membrane protein TolC